MIEPGTKLAHYEVLSALGKGGMGEVWRARDTKLGREVAIKSLPDRFAQDEERLGRFEREAKLLASLSHSNIAAIYGLEEHDGARLLVLELVEGDTLAERIERGPIPIAEALKLSLQVTEALEAAHAKGVIHRDLKPSNVKITPDGRVKVLDFGLAKAFETDQSTPDLANSPTLSLQATQQGVILGTAAYMSPEQAQGHEVDRRTDIWAFGCVLFEMLTGQSIFKSESVSRTLARVLERDPDLSLLPANLDPRVRDLIERCLEKDPDDRWHDIADVRVGIGKALSTTGGIRPEAVAEDAASPKPSPLPWAIAAAGFVVAAVLGGVLWSLPEADPGPVIRFSIPTPENPQGTGTILSRLGISPDGTQIAYVAGNTQIYIRPIGESEPRLLSGIDAEGPGLGNPVFSPDGQSLVFIDVATVNSARLMRVPISGGTPVPLWEGTVPGSVSWPDAETILFTTGDRIATVPANGGEERVLVTASNEVLESPQLLPGGNALLFTSGLPGGWNEATIYIQEIGSDERITVWEGGSDALYVPSGHVIYANANNLFALPFDLDRREPAGGVVSVVQGTRRSDVAGIDTAQYAVSDNGTLVHAPGTGGAIAVSDQRALVWVDANGDETPIPVPLNDYRVARISPDGTRVALTVGGPGDVWVYDLETGTGGPITADPDANEFYPLWASNDQIVFFSNRVDAPGLYTIPASGGAATLVAAASDFNAGFGTYPSSVSSDGNRVFMMEASQTESHIAVMDLTDPESFRRIVSATSASPVATHPEIAPNGNWLAATETFDGNTQILIRPYPDVDLRRTPVAPNPAEAQGHPLFSRDGSQLFYLSMTTLGIYSVDIAYEPQLAIGRSPRLAVSGPYRYGGANAGGRGGRAYDLHPDGRFLMIREGGPLTDQSPGAPAPENQINVVVNWLDEVTERAPAD